MDDINVVQFGYTAVCSASDYKKIALASRRFQCRVSMISKHGLYFKIRKLLSRKGIFAGILIFCISCLILSKMIWRIDITAENNQKKSLIANELFNNGVYPGVFYDNEKMKALKNRIMLDYDDVSYVSFNFYKGVLECLVYPVTEKENYTLIQSESNIHARLSGVITDLRVYYGFAKVQIGQSVSRGDLLVSNTDINKYNYISTSPTAAYVEGVCRKEYSVFVPYENKSSLFTGEYAKENTIYFMGKKYKKSHAEKNSSPSVIKRSRISQLDILGFKFPLTIKTDIYYSVEQKHTSDDILAAYTKARTRIAELIEKDEKLKKEFSRRNSYTFEERGVVYNCTVEGSYIMT